MKLGTSPDPVCPRSISPQFAASLLNQQIWCWGRDIECTEGNLPVRHGFQRIEKPKGCDASSLYRLNLSPTSRVILRGFGVFCGDDRWGGVFLRRFGFVPQFTPESDLLRPAWSLEDLPQLALPSKDQMSDCRHLLLTLVDWIRQYEVWIAESVGIAYRRETLRTWNAKHDVLVRAEEMSAAWRILGTALADHLEEVVTCFGSGRLRHA